jgi:hypothetical protein
VRYVPKLAQKRQWERGAGVNWVYFAPLLKHFAPRFRSVMHTLRRAFTRPKARPPAFARRKWARGITIAQAKTREKVLYNTYYVK